MQLSNLLSQDTICALQSAIVNDSYVPKRIGAFTQDFFYKLAAYHQIVLSEKLWKNIERAVMSEGIWLVHFANKKAEVRNIQPALARAKATVLWKLGEYLKNDEGLVIVRNGKWTHINWETWKRVYSELSGGDELVLQDAPTRSELQAIRSERKRERVYSELCVANRYRKNCKGHAMSFEDHKAAYHTIKREVRNANITRIFNDIFSN